MICMTGLEILVESVKQLSDSADSDLQSEIVEILNELDDDDVIATTDVRARQMGSVASVDVSVEIPSVLSTTATRAVENRVRQRLLKELDRRRGGETSSCGVIANIYAKPYLRFMEDLDGESPMTASSQVKHIESEFAKRVFEKFDTDFDGRLSEEDLKAGIEKALKIKLSAECMVMLMNDIDIDKNGYIEVEEMVIIDKLKKKIELLSKEEREVVMKRKQMKQHQWYDQKHESTMDGIPLSVTYIEQLVRQEAKLLRPEINGIEGVTVHYTSQTSVIVDVNIRVSEENNGSLIRIRQYGVDLKNHLLSEIQEIEDARIYLDLNS